MQEHPIPQDITGYRFHIIGSMTLKQFGEIFVGVVFGVIIYSTNLAGVIKWPLILFSVGLGAAAAFIPIEERPLDHWISTFIKVMYKPTKFFWKRETSVPEAFLFENLASTVIQEPELDLTPAKRQRAREYLDSVPEKRLSSTDFTPEETNRMNNILSSFDSVVVSTPKAASRIKPSKNKPSLDFRVREMREPQDLFPQSARDISQSNDTLTSNDELNSPEEVIVFNNSNNNNTGSQTTIAKDNVGVLAKSDQMTETINIPKQETIKIERSKTNNSKTDSVVAATPTTNDKVFIENTAPTQSGATTTENVIFNSNLPFPTKPTEPNKLVGMVLSKNNDLLAGSIVEVKTMDGRIERAVKTNALGQFYITTPLRAGEYNIEVDKEGYEFKPMKININNEIIQPVEVRSEN